MDNSSLSRLPTELLHLVAENADGSTRASIAQTCRALNAVATPLLYRRAEIKEGKSHAFIRTISAKYANLVRSIRVGNRDSQISPCQIAPCLDKLENLVSLDLTGHYWAIAEQHNFLYLGEPWDAIEELLGKYFERASLKQPTHSRFNSNLRSLTLENTEILTGCPAFFHYPEVFMIPQLHELTLRGFRLEEYRRKMDKQYERQTELKSLRIERCWVAFPVLEFALHGPRGLQYLSIGHAKDYKWHHYGAANDNDATLDQFMDCLLLHRDSLKAIEIIHEEVDPVRRHDTPSFNDPSFQEYARHFSKLECWEGCDEHSLARLLRGRSSFEDDAEVDE